jgi:hypothetical protein
MPQGNVTNLQKQPSAGSLCTQETINKQRTAWNESKLEK